MTTFFATVQDGRAVWCVWGGKEFAVWDFLPKFVLYISMDV